MFPQWTINWFDQPRAQGREQWWICMQNDSFHCPEAFKFGKIVRGSSGPALWHAKRKWSTVVMAIREVSTFYDSCATRFQPKDNRGPKCNFSRKLQRNARFEGRLISSDLTQTVMLPKHCRPAHNSRAFRTNGNTLNLETTDFLVLFD